MQCPQCGGTEAIICGESHTKNHYICADCQEIFPCDRDFHFIEINILNDRGRSLHQLAIYTIRRKTANIYREVSRDIFSKIDKQPIQSVFEGCFFLVLGYFLVKLLLNHYKIIVNPFQNEFREGAILLSTKSLFTGVNLYDLVNQPQFTNVYGIFYHLIVYPFAKIFGVNLPVHRAVTAIFIISTCIGLFWLMYKQLKISFLLCLSGSIILYYQLIYLVNPLARPDGLGLFIFLCGLFIPWQYQFSTTSLIVSIILGILGLLTKPYFFLLIPYIFLYLFIFKSKLSSIKYGLLSLVALLITVLTTNFLFESYFNNTFFAHLNAPIGNDLLNDPYFSIIQFSSYISHNMGLSIISLTIFSIYLIHTFLIYLNLLTKRHNSPNQFNLNIFSTNVSFDMANLNEPLIRNKKLANTQKQEQGEHTNPNLNIDFVVFCLCMSMFIFFARMGHHRGNWLIYIHQLISPFLIILIFKFLDDKWRSPLKISLTQNLQSSLVSIPRIETILNSIANNFYRLVFSSLIILNLFTLTANDFLFEFTYGTEDWLILRNLIAEHNNIFNSPAIASLLVEQNKPVYDSGLSEYFSDGIKSRKTFGIPFPPDKKSQDHFKNYKENINQSIRTKQFDLIVLSNNYSPFISEDLVKEYYQKTKTLQSPMLFTLQNYELNIWEPR
ncbi:MAG: hypothetical protein DCF20_08135 [Pseudanabaena sp.]|nr:MAG: hypothetical protein DCF20_08135 [Pseudanabaena sp.]